MFKLFKKFNFYFLFTLIVFIPFQGILGNILSIHTSSSAAFWLTHWYESILLLLFFVSFLFLIRGKLFTANLVPYLLFIAIGILSVLFFSPTLSRGLEGFRFTILPVLVLLPAYIFLSDSQTKKLINLYLIMACFVAGWGLLEWAFHPFKYWSAWGLVSSSTIFGYGWHGVGSKLQIASVFGGPNQLASYLLPAFFIILVRVIELLRMKRDQKFYLSLLGLIGLPLAIFLAYSRSAWLGLIIPVVILPFFITKKRWIKITLLSLVVIASIGLAILYKQGNPLLTHGRSQSEHASAVTQGLNEIKSRFVSAPIKILLGDGLGTSGPAVLKYKDGLVPESWYLQLILEVGLVGFVLWCYFIVILMVNLWKNNSKGIALGILSISIAAIFLHTWADNPSVAYSIMILIGANIYSKSKAVYE